MNLNLGLGNLTKTLSKDKIGILIGYLATQAQYAQDHGNDLIFEITKNLTRISHLPSLEGITYELRQGSPSKTVNDFLKLGIVSLILKEVNIHPMVTRWAKVGTNVGFMGLVGVGLAAGVWSAGHSAHKSGGEGHSSGGKSETWKYQA